MGEIDTRVIADGTIEEFVDKLKELYGSASISYDKTADGSYVIKNGERYLFEVDSSVQIGKALKFVSENPVLVQELSGTSNQTSMVIDTDKLNVATENVGNYNYNINIDVEAYRGIIEGYRDIIETLKMSVKHAKSGMITGELRSYYDSIVKGNEVDIKVEGIINDIEDIIVRMETALNTYENIDEDLSGQLNSILSTIFTMDKQEIASLGMTIEERQEQLGNIINELEKNLKILQEEYDGLLKTDGKEVSKLLHLFDALKIDKFDCNTVYDENTGSYNASELGKMVIYLQENKVSSSFNSYFKEGKDWQESGMENLFGTNLKNYYWLRENRTYNEEENSHLDSETLFMENYMNGFYSNDSETTWGKHDGPEDFTKQMRLYGEYCLEKYEGLKNYEDYYIEDDLKIKEGFNLTYEEWFAKREKSQMDYYILHQAELQKEGYNSYEEYSNSLLERDESIDRLVNTCFRSDISQADGQYYYRLNDIEGYEWTKDTTLKMVKSYISTNGALDTLNNAEQTYEKSQVVKRDIGIFSNAIYNYKQYYKLMPFEDERNNSTYMSKYMTKIYDENYENECLPEDWLKYLDRNEVALIDYLYNEKGAGEAKKYIDAMSDTVNQRIGFASAKEFADSLNNKNKLNSARTAISGIVTGNPTLLAIAALQELNNKFFPEQIDTIIDTGKAINEGFGDGNYNFLDGWVDLFTADGVRDAKDYEFMYKVALLNDPKYKSYTDELSDKERKWLSNAYKYGNSLGYMTIPTLLSYVPVVGQALSLASLAGSSSGNNTENLMQQGVSKERSYLYGGLMGISETAIEMLCGGLPGSASTVGNGVKHFIKTTLGESGEEAFQTYVSRGIESVATGEPFDIASVTEEAKEAAIMAIFTTATMNAGGRVMIKTADSIIETSPSEFNSYEEWRASIETKFSNNYSDLASILGLNGNSNQSTEFTLNVDKSELSNIDSNQQGLISNLTYNPNTSKYQVTLLNGSTFEVPNLNMVTSSLLASNMFGETYYASQPKTNTISDYIQTKFQGLYDSLVVNNSVLESFWRRKFDEVYALSDSDNALLETFVATMQQGTQSSQEILDLASRSFNQALGRTSNIQQVRNVINFAIDMKAKIPEFSFIYDPNKRSQFDSVDKTLTMNSIYNILTFNHELGHALHYHLNGMTYDALAALGISSSARKNAIRENGRYVLDASDEKNKALIEHSRDAYNRSYATRNNAVAEVNAMINDRYGSEEGYRRYIKNQLELISREEIENIVNDFVTSSDVKNMIIGKVGGLDSIGDASLDDIANWIIKEQKAKCYMEADAALNGSESLVSDISDGLWSGNLADKNVFSPNGPLSCFGGHGNAYYANRGWVGEAIANYTSLMLTNDVEGINALRRMHGDELIDFLDSYYSNFKVD